MQHWQQARRVLRRGKRGKNCTSRLRKKADAWLRLVVNHMGWTVPRWITGCRRACITCLSRGTGAH
ncbi:hypothetical protein D3C77_770530 [compost metagenome]